MSDNRRAEEWPPTGQGNALPDFAGVDGQWIWEGYLFLFKPPAGTKTGDVSMTMALHRKDGTPAHGVDAEFLAGKLGLTIELLLAHNTAGTLYIAARTDAPGRGGTSARTYRFRVGSAETALTFEEGLPTGQA